MSAQQKRNPFEEAMLLWDAVLQEMDLDQDIELIKAGSVVGWVNSIATHPEVVEHVLWFLDTYGEAGCRHVCRMLEASEAAMDHKLAAMPQVDDMSATRDVVAKLIAKLLENDAYWGILTVAIQELPNDRGEALRGQLLQWLGAQEVSAAA